MSETQDERINLVAQLGFRPCQVVQEFGFNDDVDHELRETIQKVTDQDLVNEDYADTVDAVLLWFRDNDGNLTTALLNIIVKRQDGGVIWVLTPKAERDGYVAPSDISKAAKLARLSETKSVSIAKDWTGTRLVAPRR
ncbi:DUF3052 domain-containing protein [Streptomyces subrutilus]|uniref:DUF3052 domain-containing protein n=1 Tax=Streptomyces subrutilus TaxID=36818 RepID=A0A1E5PKF2_9ACTN|nr:DUF3052 domain-containing protein [Streptomyces subrutilus]OEJ30048.1 hypothetical protein BGK67_00395 [Streptomyces subrutilus]